MALLNKIKSVKAREILDSRGNPTLEVEVSTEGGVFAAAVPSGASVGKYEAMELRDGGRRYRGKGVLEAVKNVNDVIGPKIKKLAIDDQWGIDSAMKKLDSTENKSKLGANAIVGVSMAVCRAAAENANIPLWQHISRLFANTSSHPGLPTACFNIINGGAHAGNNLDFQEFMVVPNANGKTKIKFAQDLRIASEVYHELKKHLKTAYGPQSINVGDEGGFAPPMKNPQEALEAIMSAVKKLAYQKEITIFLDIAASQFYKNGRYETQLGNFSREELSAYYKEIFSQFPIAGLEDPFAEEDWEGWSAFAEIIKTRQNKPLLIGDDLLATNPKRIEEAHEKNACSALLLKINQIGTVTEALEAARLARAFNWKIVVSHRSGETCDDFIADFAVGIGAEYIKAGAPARGERLAKYNRLLRIGEELA